VNDDENIERRTLVNSLERVEGRRIDFSLKGTRVEKDRLRRRNYWEGNRQTPREGKKESTVLGREQLQYRGQAANTR